MKILENNDCLVEFPNANMIKKENNYYVVSKGNLHVFTINQVDFNDFVNIMMRILKL